MSHDFFLRSCHNYYKALRLERKGTVGHFGPLAQTTDAVLLQTTAAFFKLQYVISTSAASIFTLLLFKRKRPQHYGGVIRNSNRNGKLWGLGVRVPNSLKQFNKKSKSKKSD